MAARRTGRRAGGRAAAAGPAGGEQAAQRDGQAQQPVDEHDRARQVCLRLLGARPRTRAELATALRRKGVADEVAAAVLDRLTEVGLVDDAAFADSYVYSQHAYQGLGRRALTAQLRRRGVDHEVTSAAVATVDADAERARAVELVSRRLQRMPDTDEPTAIRRLVGMLARKGYPQGLAYDVVRTELRRAGRDSSALDGAMPDDAVIDPSDE